MDSNMIVNVFTIICGITCLAGYFMMFRDMGRSGWLCLIPIYNTYVMFDEVYDWGWKCLLLLIPIFNIYVAIKLLVDWVRKYGLTTSFLLYIIPGLILGFLRVI